MKGRSSAGHVRCDRKACKGRLSRLYRSAFENSSLDCKRPLFQIFARMPESIYTTAGAFN